MTRIMGALYFELFFVLLFIKSVLSGEEYPCSGTCDPTQQTVFKVGHTYVYTYTSEVITSANISDDVIQNKDSRLSFTSDVEIYILSPCELIMKIENPILQSHTKISETVNRDDNEAKAFSDALTKNSVHIHYSNGSIPEICVGDPEPSWVLNVKRGIVSLLQYSTEDTNHTVVESDIQGTCEQWYTNKEVDGWRIVKKRSDLSRCLNRGGPNIYLTKKAQFYTTIYPLDYFKSSRVCKYVLGDTQQPVTVTCKERHRFLPVYTAWNMFVTSINQILTLDRVILKEMPAFKDELRKESLFFKMENQDGELFRLESLNDFVAHFKTVDRDMLHSLFTSPNVVALFRNATYDELAYAFNSYNTVYRNLLHLLYLVKTEASIKFVLAPANRQENTDSLESWLRSLPFVRNPTIEMLDNLRPALDIEVIKDIAFLGVSGMVYTYCAGRDACSREPAVAALLGHWEAPLSRRAESMRLMKKPHRSAMPKENSDDYADILLSLKAVGNAGVTNNLNAIMDIIQDRQLPGKVRIAAMESLRRMPNIIQMACEDLSKLLQGIDDVEVRIASYLMALTCKPANLLEKIRFQLQYEETNEVTSFMWNHLSQTLPQLPENLRSNITELLHDEFFRSKYQLDISNSASFQGMNKSFPTLHTQFVADRKIIYKNRFPWIAAFNVGFSVFTNKTDIIEIGGHCKDVNSLIQATFGRKNIPKKFHPEIHPGNSQEDHENNIITDDEHTKQKHIKSTEQLEAQLYVKIFGNDLLYTYNIQDLFADLKEYDDLDDLRKTLDPEDFVDFSKSVNAMKSFTFPTSIGFPIEIGTNASVVWGAKSNGTSDNKESPLSKFDMAFDMIMYFTLNFSGSMVVDANIFKKGLNLTIDSAIQQTMKWSLNLAGDKRVHHKIEMPENQNSRFDLKTKVEEIF